MSRVKKEIKGKSMQRLAQQDPLKDTVKNMLNSDLGIKSKLFRD